MTRNQKKLLVTVMAASLIGGALAAEQHEHGHHHQHFAQDIDAFHGVLAPVWHAPQGKARSQNACAKAGQMVRLANDIGSTDASGLKASLATLQKTCQKKGDVDGALFEVHEEFHRLIEPKRGA
jgi:hypothetical protein